MKRLKILVVGCGNMGSSHATSYHSMSDSFEICGLVSRGDSKTRLNEKFGKIYPLFNSFEEALEVANTDAVCITTYPDTHEEYAIKALDRGCHVFIKKPVADTARGAKRVVEKAIEKQKKW